MSISVLEPGLNEAPSPTIVVGYDGSPAALAAVDHAIDRALPDGNLILVHAYSVPVDYAGASYYAQLHEDAAKWAETVLDNLERDRERLATVEHERDISVGPAGPAIVRAAELHAADEIIIGSRGHGRVRALLGSVAHDVIHRAQCPVTVIPERMAETQTALPAAVSGAV
jgi:nucleotide-binding universal stress UspA family protein